MALFTYKTPRRNWLRRIQQHHALEHATIHVLSRQHPRQRVMGRSDLKGFYLYTDLPLKAIEVAVSEGLHRLHAGQHELAIHPNCGTNLLTTGILTASAAYLSLVSDSDRKNPSLLIDRLPAAILMTTMAAVISKPLGHAIQKHVTTNADVVGLETFSVSEVHQGRYTLFRIQTHQQAL